MATIVIIPGGYHPYHAGHLALYQSAQRAFPDAEVYVAATNDTSARPFPFPVKEKLAKLAGVEAGHFVQVKSPFRAEEITSKFDPSRDTLIFVRSEKDSTKPPQPGGVKKDGSPAYLQPLLGAKKLEPFAKHAYMAYLPTVEFGPGMTSATEIRSAWPQLNDKRKTALVMSLYPKTQGNAKLAANVVALLDAAIGTQGVAEGLAENSDQNGWYVLDTKNRKIIANDVSRERAIAIAKSGGYSVWQTENGTFINSAKTVRYPGLGWIDVSETMNEQGVAEDSLNEFAVDGFGDSGDNRSKLLASVGRLLDGGNKVDWQVPGQMGHVTRVQNDGITMKRWKMPRSRMSFFLPMSDDSRDSKYTIKMVAPKHYAVVSAAQGMAEAATKCPPATQDIGINLENRQKAIDEYGYGPLNPDLPNTKFWMLKVDEWNLDSMEEAQQSLCGNCAAFDVRQDTLDCIAQGIDSDSPDDAEGVIDAGELGYCKFLKFKCASRRTCDAWVTGGPLVDKPVDENQGWAATLESDQVDVATDPELVHARRFARQHYPEFSGDEDLAFAKWVQRGLGHSEKNDREHDRKLKQLTNKVAMLQAALQQQAKNSDYLEEKWSAEYKSSIDCNNPRGFSQKAHCAGRKK